MTNSENTTPVVDCLACVHTHNIGGPIDINFALLTELVYRRVCMYFCTVYICIGLGRRAGLGPHTVTV